MVFDDAYLLGYIKKTHGLKGEVLVALDVDDPSYYNELESVFLNQNGALVPFFIRSFSVRGKEALMHLDEFESLDQASSLVGTEMWLPLKFLPPLPGGGFYYHQLLDYEVHDGKEPIGVVKNIYDLPNNFLLGVQHSQTKQEILVPTQDEVMETVDHEARKITVKLPEGLVDLYIDGE